MSSKMARLPDALCSIIEECPMAYWLTAAGLILSEDRWEERREGCPCFIKVQDIDAGKDEFFCSAKSLEDPVQISR